MGFSGLFSRKLTNSTVSRDTEEGETSGLDATYPMTRRSKGFVRSTHLKGPRLAAKDKRRVARASRQQQRRQRKHK